MRNFYYFLRIIQIIAPKVGGVITGIIKVILIAVAAFWRGLMEASEAISEELKVPRIISVLIAITIWIFMAHITVWLTHLIRYSR